MDHAHERGGILPAPKPEVKSSLLYC